MNRIKSWVSQILDRLNVLSLSMVLITLYVVARGLVKVVHGLEPSLLSNMVCFGTLTGWVLALTPVTGWTASLLGLLTGILVVLLRIGRIGPDLFTIFRNMAENIRPMPWWIIDPQTLDWTPITTAFLDLIDSIDVLLTRLSDWVLAWVNGEPIFDPVSIAVVWSLAIWIVAVWAGWVVRRRQKPLLALIPAGALIGITLAFTGSRTTSLFWLLITMLPMLAIVNHEIRQRQWRKTGIQFSPSLWQSIAVWSILLSMVIVVAAALTQSMSLKGIVDFTRRLRSYETTQREQVAESLGMELQPVGQPGQMRSQSNVSIPSSSRQHLIRSSPKLSEQEVMALRISPPVGSGKGKEGDVVGPSVYLRRNTYDRYTSRGWKTGNTEAEKYEAGEQVSQIDLPGHRLIKQELVAIAEPSQAVYVVGTLVTTDQDFTVEWRSAEDSFGAFFSEPTNSSQVVSLIPVVSEDELRASGSDYPDWVKTLYLSLPDTVPGRVLTLARDLTATAPTPYDRALAIESYLREFPYTSDTPVPSLGQDVTDYFLFDLQKGYCDYYATSMVVLARAAGIPARMVVGFMSDRYDPDLEAYIITEDQAHSWAEIYFPGYGWVEFEPTAGLSTHERQEFYVGIEHDELERLLEMEGRDRLWLDLDRVTQNKNWKLAISVSLLAIGVGVVAWFVVDRWRLLHLSTVEVASEVYNRLQRHSKKLKIKTDVGITPYELSDIVVNHVAQMARRRFWGWALAPAQEEMIFLTNSYAQVSYSTHLLGDDAKGQMIRTWWKLRRRFWIAWLRTKFGRLPSSG
ncbi:MAG TPA: transglutaminase domain-containing protein [Anaerolineae bacterium]|nr:transglutaminase domain-containing protein [Anaerolineae bacterium]